MNWRFGDPLRGHAPRFPNFKSEFDKLITNVENVIAQKECNGCSAIKKAVDVIKAEEKKWQDELSRMQVETAKYREEEAKKRQEEEPRRRAEEERKQYIINERRSKNVCIMCGAGIGFFGRLFGREKHSSCQQFQG
ncbi:MAG: hypothetical protein HY289_13190 [Planctomycetes bacterium]|nr:hypothetical protein [Planctomycetota bacterium]